MVRVHDSSDDVTDSSHDRFAWSKTVFCVTAAPNWPSTYKCDRVRSIKKLYAVNHTSEYSRIRSRKRKDITVLQGQEHKKTTISNITARAYATRAYEHEREIDLKFMSYETVQLLKGYD